MLKNYFKTAIRNLLRNKVYSFINMAGLSLGLACSIMIILYVRDEVSFDRFHKNISQLYRIDRKIVRPNGDISKAGYTGYLQGKQFSAAIPEITGFVRMQSGGVTIKRGADIESREVNFVDPTFFRLFSFPLLSGNPDALKEPHSVVITEEMARIQFGTADAVGKTMLLKLDSAFEPYLVGAVARNCPQNSSIDFRILLPLTVSAAIESKNENWFNFFLNTYVLLRPGADPGLVNAKMQQVFLTDAAESIKGIQEKYGIRDLGISYFLQPLTDIHLNTEINGQGGVSRPGDPLYSYILSAIALFILLIACINFINLTVARSLKRAREIGIRKVIGGQRKQLMLQFLGESFLLCFVAFVAAMLIAFFLLPLFNQLSNKALSFSYLSDPKLIAGYIALLLVTGLLAGLYPAFVLSGYNPVETLYSRFNLAGKNYLQKTLVVFQFSLATFLIIATFALFFQLNYLSSQPLGYDDTHLVLIEKPDLSRNETAQFKRQLLENPAILGVSAKNPDFSGNTVKVNGATAINITIETIDTGYLPLLKVPFVEGRNFSASYASDAEHSVIVNEAFVKEAGWKHPIGQEIASFEPVSRFTVIGVVKDYHYKPLTEAIQPQVFSMDPAGGYGTLYVRIASQHLPESLDFIGKTFRGLFPLTPFSYSFKEQLNAKNYEAEEKWKQMILFAAVLTIFISCIGLFGLSVLSAEKRIKEIGIRKVLGASVGGLVKNLSLDFLKLVLIALFISMPIAWLAVSKWLQHYPYRITLSGWMFVCAGGIVIFVAMGTISFQAVKSALLNPVKSLRSE